MKLPVKIFSIGILALVLSGPGCGKEIRRPDSPAIRPQETKLLVNKTWRLKYRNYEYEQVTNSYRDELDANGRPFTKYKTKEVREIRTEVFNGSTLHATSRTVTGEEKDNREWVETVSNITSTTKPFYIEEIVFSSSTGQPSYEITAYDNEHNQCEVSPASYNTYEDFWGWVDSSEPLLYWDPIGPYLSGLNFDVSKLTDTELVLGYQTVIDNGEAGYRSTLVRMEFEKVDTPHCKETAVSETPQPLHNPCAHTIDLTGTWKITFACHEKQGGSEQTFEGTEMLEVQEKNNYVMFHSEGDTNIFSGPVCKDTVTWSGVRPQYTERGTWRVIDANTFTAETFLTRTGETHVISCAGQGTRR